MGVEPAVRKTFRAKSHRLLPWMELFHGRNPLFNVVLKACNLGNIIFVLSWKCIHYPLSTNLKISRSFSKDRTPLLAP